MNSQNKGSLIGARGPPPSNMRPPFFGAPLPIMRPPISQLVNPMMIPRQRLMPPIRGPIIYPGYGPRVRGPPPMMPPRNMGPRGPIMRGTTHALPHMRPKFPHNHLHSKLKGPNNQKKSNKQEGDSNESKEPDVFDDSNDHELETEINLCCEVCDRDFLSIDKLEKHLQEHQTCNIDGCKFSAHAKIVEKHIIMQHNTGLYQRLKTVMDEDNLEKWKLERKKHYPTAARVKLQEKEESEKILRGEVIKIQGSKRINQKEFNKDRNHKNRKRKRFRNSRTKNSEQENVAESSSDKTISSSETASQEKDFNLKSEETPKTQDKEETKKNPVIQSLSLIADYGSDSNEDEAPDEVPAKIIRTENSNETANIQETANELSIKNSLGSEDTKKVDKNLSSDNISPICKKDKNSEIHENKSKEINITYKSSDKRLNLLRKLLARSIQHERNSICQCITYIAKNNFFD